MPAALLARRTLLLAALAVAGPVQAGDDDNAEYQVKAAFLCKFGNYIEWPPQALAGSAPFRIGVLGGESVAEELRRTAAATTVAGHPIEVHRLERGELPEGLHAVFLTRAMAPQAPALLNALQGRPVLTVTELEPGGPAGIINFVVVDDKVRFDILLPSAAQSGLKISVRLLSVARRVEGRS